MNRTEAVAILKELSSLNIISTPSIITLDKKADGKYQLQFKLEGEKAQLRSYVTYKKLALLVDVENRTCRIYKP